MKRQKHSSPLLTKSEFSLLFGGLLILGSIFMMNSESKKISNKEQTVTKTYKKEVTKETQITEIQRAPAQEKSQKKNDEVLVKEVSPIDKITKAEICIKSKSCDLPDSDPRSYNLAAYKGLSDEIRENKSFVLMNWNSKLTKDFKRYLGYHDGHVKAAVLETILDLDSRESSDFVDVVISDVLSDHNTQLMDLTMDYINKIQDPAAKLKIENAWLETMLTGSPNKSEALAKYSHHLINDQSLPKFKQVLDQLPKESAERTHLESSLTEFEMTQSGG